MKTITIAALSLALSAPFAAAQATSDNKSSFENAAASMEQQLLDAERELAELRDAMAAEQIPLSRQLSELEAELISVRAESQQTTRLLDSRTLDLSNLRQEISRREEEASYLTNLLGEYGRNLESRLHIAELQRYEADLEAARLALGNEGLEQAEVFAAQATLLATSIDRLEDSLSGTRFEGTAVNPDGIVENGTFLLIGPTALFRSDDGSQIGMAEQRLGSLEPSLLSFGDPLTAQAASDLVATGNGRFPLDPTLGNAHKIEATQESFLEHVKKGGAVMWPIFGMAAVALLIALWKWISMAFVAKPSRAKINSLLEAVAAKDEEAVNERVSKLRGPVGEMLAAGVAHLREPRELIEEIMYEKVLTTRLKLERMLPFIAICASSAPLLGLLGTVTGIINTFKLITVFGSGDVKSLSGGISEALITTKFGLIVAIPSLLLHAFLSRKSRGVTNAMETGAVAFANQVSKTPWAEPQPMAAGAAPQNMQLPPLGAEGFGGGASGVREQVREVLQDMLAPGSEHHGNGKGHGKSGSIKTTPSIPTTVAD